MVDISKELDKLLEIWLPKFLKSMMIDYGIGSLLPVNDAMSEDVKISKNPLGMTKKEQEANTKIIKDLVKGVNDDMAKKINYLVNKSVTDKWSNKQLAKELDGIFDKDSPNYFNYKNRNETIAFNETNRLLNNGSFGKAKKAGATGKYLQQGRRNPWPDSVIALNKYGSPEKAIPLDDFFTFTYKGKQQTYQMPPGRVNDSEMISFTFLPLELDE